MTIYPDPPPVFTCVLCGEIRDVHDTPWKVIADRARFDIPPICRICELYHSNRSRAARETNRDRRMANHILLLADALSAEAWRKMPFTRRAGHA